MDDRPILDLASVQDGVVARWQVERLGMTARKVEWRVASGRWLRVHRGVYVVRPGPVDHATTVSAAVLACGETASLCRGSAAYAWGLSRVAPQLVSVLIPATRRVTPPEGVDLVRGRYVASRVVGSPWPPRTTVEPRCWTSATSARPTRRSPSRRSPVNAG